MCTLRLSEESTMGKAIAIGKQKMHRAGGVCVIGRAFVRSLVSQKGGL